MKKIFITGIIWEIVRFTSLFLTTITKISPDLLLFFSAQQLVIFYIYFFIILDTEKYCQYLKILTAGKFIALFSGVLYLIKLFIKNTEGLAGFIFPVNLVLIDTLFFIILLHITAKHFKNYPVSEE